MDESTFWASSEQRDGCLIWTRGRSGPYGYCVVDGKFGVAHRAAFYLTFGRWPVGHLHHTCPNQLCVNVEHLKEVTPSEHMFIHNRGTETHCGEGHEYSGHNLIEWRGKRFCRECGRKRQREYLRRKNSIPEERWIVK